MNEEERDEYDNPLKGGAGPDRARSHSYDDSQFPPGAATDKSTASSPQPSEDGDSSRHPVQRRRHSGVVSGAGAVGLSTLTSTLSSKLFGEADFDEGSDETPAKDHELRRHGCGLLHPDTGVRQLYDLLQMSILLWFLFILPYRLGFVIEPKGWEILLDIVIDCILGVDILLNFHMYYRSRITGLLVFNKSELRKHYLKSWFVVDFFTVCPFDQIFRVMSLQVENEATKHQLAVVANEVRVLKMARLVKLGRLKELINPKKLSTLLATLLMPLGIHGVELAAMFYMRIAVLVFTLVGCCHVVACWWVGLGVEYAANGTGWMIDYWGREKYAELESSEKYGAAMYFVFVTVSSTGYGDISATNSSEEMVSSVIVVFGVFMLAYIVGTFGMMISNIAGDSNKFDAKMRSITGLMKRINAPILLKTRVRDFYNAKGDALLRNDETIYRELPGALRRNLVRARYSPILTKIPFLRGLSDLIIVKICATVKEFSVMSGDIVCRRGDKRQDLILITLGIVTIMHSDLGGDDEDDEEVSKIKVGSRKWRLRQEFANKPENSPIDHHGRNADVPGQERDAGTYFGLDEFIGLRDTCSVTLKARIYCEVSVLDRRCRVLERIIQEEYQLRHRLDTYAMAQHGIDKIMEDGHVGDEEVTALYDKLELAMQASVARDDARKSAQVQQGEVAMANVFGALHAESMKGISIEERKIDAVQAQLNALETKLERRLDEITQLLGGTPSGR